MLAARRAAVNTIRRVAGVRTTAAANAATATSPSSHARLPWTASRALASTVPEASATAAAATSSADDVVVTDDVFEAPPSRLLLSRPVLSHLVPLQRPGSTESVRSLESTLRYLARHRRAPPPAVEELFLRRARRIGNTATADAGQLVLREDSTMRLMLGCLSRAGDVVRTGEYARAIQPPSAFAYNAWLKAYANANDSGAGMIAVWSEMRELGLHPDTSAYKHLLAAFASIESPSLGLVSVYDGVEAIGDREAAVVATLAAAGRGADSLGDMDGGINDDEDTHEMLAVLRARAAAAVQLSPELERASALGLKPVSRAARIAAAQPDLVSRHQGLVAVFTAMEADRVVPTTAMYACALRSYARAGELHTLVELEQQMRATMVPIDSTVYHALLEAHIDDRAAFQACWARMLAEGVRPNTHCFNTRFAMLARTARDPSLLLEELRAAYSEMLERSHGARPDAATCVVLASALLDPRFLVALAVRVEATSARGMRNARARGERNPASAAAAAAREWISRELLRNVAVRNAVRARPALHAHLFRILLSAAGRARDAAAVRALHRELLQEEARLADGESGAVAARKSNGAARKGTNTAAAAASANVANTADATTEEAEEEQVDVADLESALADRAAAQASKAGAPTLLTAATYVSLLEAMARTFGESQPALMHEVLRDARARGEAPRELYGVLISMHARLGDLAQVERLFNALTVDRGLHPGARILATMVRAYAQAGQLERIQALFDAREARLGAAAEANEATAEDTAAMDASAELARDASEERAELDRLFVEVLAQLGDHSRMLMQFVGMTRRGVSPRATTYHSMMQALARRGERAQVLLLFEDMESAGVAPNLGVLSTLLDAVESMGAAPSGDDADALAAELRLRARVLAACEAAAFPSLATRVEQLRQSLGAAESA